MTNQTSLLDKIISTLMLAEKPELLKDGSLDKSKIDSVNKKRLKKYSTLLMEINWAYKKIERYPLYFSEFYPAENQIDKNDALEHHFHAYLEDLTIFKNRLLTFLGTLKNDLKKNAINKKEVEEGFSVFMMNVRNSFENVAEYRNPHSHQGRRFLDVDLVDGRLAKTLLADSNPLKSSFKPEFLKSLEKQKEESFDKAKNNWIERAKNNNKQMKGLLNKVLEVNESHLYQSLDLQGFAEDLDVLREKRAS